MNFDKIVEIRDGDIPFKRRIISRVLRSLGYTKHKCKGKNSLSAPYQNTGTKFTKHIKLTKNLTYPSLHVNIFLQSGAFGRANINCLEFPEFQVRIWGGYNYVFVDSNGNQGSWIFPTGYKFNPSLYKSFPKVEFSRFSTNKNVSQFMITLIEIKVCKELLDIKECIQNEIEFQKEFKNKQREKTKQNRKKSNR